VTATTEAMKGEAVMVTVHNLEMAKYNILQDRRISEQMKLHNLGIGDLGIVMVDSEEAVVDLQAGSGKMWVYVDPDMKPQRSFVKF